MIKKFEMIYPYILSLLPAVGIEFTGLSLVSSNNLNDALEAVITVSSLIIGFIGAVLPVIMSMKNDSKIVRYVFEKDKDKLFLKYIKQTILVGVLLILLAVSIYFRDQFVGSKYERWCIGVLSYTLAAFLLCTYRSLSNMLNLIFLNDSELKKDEIFGKKTEQEKEFEKKAEGCK